MNIKKEDIETLSYIDIANILLSEKPLTTKELFEKIVNLLELPKSTIENAIGDFYTSLTTDKRFTLLDEGKWDLSINHKAEKIIIEDEEEEIDEPDSDDIIEDEDKEDIFRESTEDDTDDVSDEYKNLVIVDEEDLNTIE